MPVALAAGILLPVQFGVNSHLRNVVGGPVATAAISFVVGTVALAVAALVVQRSLPERGSAASAPWWAWTGDMLGAFFVLASIVLTPRLGAATTIGLILTGQIMASIVIDHLGLIRVPVHERKALMSELSEGFIALPGGSSGTPDDVRAAQPQGILRHAARLLRSHGREWLPGRGAPGAGPRGKRAETVARRLRPVPTVEDRQVDS